MKVLKRISLLAILIALSVGVSNAQISVNGGYSSMTNSVSNSENIGGFYAGATYNLDIQNNVSLTLGALYNLNTKSTSVLGIKVSSSSHQLDVPVRVRYTYPINSNIKVFGFAGPNFNIGLAYNSKVGNVKTNLYDSDALSRFNLQLGAGAGVQYNNIGVKLSYDWGLFNLIKDTDNTKINGFKIGLFYTL